MCVYVYSMWERVRERICAHAVPAHRSTSPAGLTAATSRSARARPGPSCWTKAPQWCWSDSRPPPAQAPHMTWAEYTQTNKQTNSQHRQSTFKGVIKATQKQEKHNKYDSVCASTMDVQTNKPKRVPNMREDWSESAVQSVCAPTSHTFHTWAKWTNTQTNI